MSATVDWGEEGSDVDTSCLAAPDRVGSPVDEGCAVEYHDLPDVDAAEIRKTDGLEMTALSIWILWNDVVSVADLTADGRSVGRWWT